MTLNSNNHGLPYLSSEIMTAIFDCVYGIDGASRPQTKKLLKQDEFKYFMEMLMTMKAYNYRYRFDQTARLFPVFEETVGPMEQNSEGTTIWLSLGLALKELYRFRISTLRDLLKKIDL